MKEVITHSGKSYSVHSSAGCTVSDDSGWSKELAAPEDYFTAHGGMVYLSDDSASVKELFKLAPIAFGGGGKPGWYDVLRSELAELLGAGNFSLTYAWVEDKFTLTLALPLDITDEQMAQVRVLLGSILPRNMVTEMEWADGLPMSYTRLEYLSNWGNAFIKVTQPIYSEQEVKSAFAIEKYQTISFAALYMCPSASTLFDLVSQNTGQILIRQGNMNYGWVKVNLNEKHSFETSQTKIVYDGKVVKTGDTGTGELGNELRLLKNVNGSAWRMYYFTLLKAGEKVLDLIPALNEETGTPCMFDLVSKKPFWNEGGDDFTYPGMETEATTYSLRNRMYAQLTEHGVRRLYHVPKCYNGSKEEYAEQNGFKLLVETPMPEEGYWMPEWHEYEDYIELDWVETDPPAEEFGNPDEETLTETE